MIEKLLFFNKILLINLINCQSLITGIEIIEMDKLVFFIKKKIKLKHIDIRSLPNKIFMYFILALFMALYKSMSLRQVSYIKNI